MSSTTESVEYDSREFWQLLSAVCDDIATPSQYAILEGLMLADPRARQVYLQYMDLHGNLFWDAAVSGAEASAELTSAHATVPCDSCASGAVATATSKTRMLTRGRKWAAVAAALLLCVGAGLWASGVFRVGSFGELAQRPLQNPEVFGPFTANPDVSRNSSPELGSDNDQSNNTNTTPQPDRNDSRELVNVPHDTLPNLPVKPMNPVVPLRKEDPTVVADAKPPLASSAAAIVSFTNQQLSESWDTAGVSVASPASDTELLRRVYLDVVGHIPPPAAVTDFMADKSDDRYERMVNRLLDEPAYSRHFATVWSNLLVGRSSARNVNYEALHRFLRNRFDGNHSWNETVAALISAEGSASENGASSFLLAHLNNQAVPATAVTARLFLCTQVQCAQCHDDAPKATKQEEFWALNSFFKQTKIEKQRRRNQQTGSMQTEPVLVSKPVGGPTFFENRKGVMQATYPEFAGVRVDDDANINRRDALAKLLTSGDRPQIARAFVNRIWSQFFGQGFTTPVDDMGPHNPPTHPLLLDRLTDEFVASGYDVKQLVRWILLSDAYRLSSAEDVTAIADNNSEPGQQPHLFQRQTVRSMTAEQLYDSMLIASKAHYGGAGNWEDVARQRRAWLQQFVAIYDTEENDEANLFNGTISQALAVMNSDLTAQAINDQPGTYFHEVVHGTKNDLETVRRLCVAALSRYPTGRELATARSLIRTRMASQRKTPQAARREALQDIFWAYLNSSEFILVH